jgi:RNA polymerase sigma-70 factor (ECF subfamily)
MNHSETELAAAAVRGDQAALTTLLEAAGKELHAELERGIRGRYRGLVDADDVWQVTCLEAFVRIRTFEYTRPGDFRAWLRRISENNLRDAVRELEREKRPPPHRRLQPRTDEESCAALFERIAATSTTASRIIARQEACGLVHAALARLPADYARVVRLCDLEGLTGAEAAEQMGRSPGAVRRLLARARDGLAELLGSASRVF